MKRKLPEIHKKRRREQQESSHEVIRVFSSLFPAGSTTFALFEAIFGNPAARRRDEFIQELAVRLATLEQKVGTLKLGDLSKNDSFITTAMHAFPIALRNHQKEKREALYNVILNAALSQELDDSVQQLFLSFVDTLTVTHLKLLKTFHFYLKNGSLIPYGLGVDPETRRTRDPAPVFMEMHFPGYGEQEDLFQQFWRDLYIRGLVRSERIRMPEGHFDYLLIGVAEEKHIFSAILLVLGVLAFSGLRTRKTLSANSKLAESGIQGVQKIFSQERWKKSAWERRRRYGFFRRGFQEDLFRMGSLRQLNLVRRLEY